MSEKAGIVLTCTLGAIVLATVVGAIVLAASDRTLPDAVIAIGSGAAVAIPALWARSPRQPDP